MPTDWRESSLDMVEHLRGGSFRRKAYVQYRRDWDHDHCEMCNVKFMEAKTKISETINEGFASTENYVHGANYAWLCADCFTFLKPRLGLIDETTGN